jgi:hypothetical protein
MRAIGRKIRYNKPINAQSDTLLFHYIDISTFRNTLRPYYLQYIYILTYVFPAIPTKNR